MAYTAKFLDNQTVGVDDFNNIIADLCGDGVIPADDSYNFETGVPYTMQKLNDMTKDAVYAAGVVPSSEEALRVTASSGIATINVGSAVFSSGLIFKVTEAETISYDEDASQYVYLVHDTSANTATIEVGETLPSETSTSTRFIVPLALIDTEGAVEDERTYAVGKLKCCANWNGTTKADFTYAAGTSSTGWTTRNVTVWDKGDEVNFIVFVAWKNTDKTTVQTLSLVTEDENGDFTILCMSNNNNKQFYTDAVHLYGGSATLSDFEHTDGGITATLEVYGTSASSTQYPVDMYVSVVE